MTNERIQRLAVAAFALAALVVGAVNASAQNCSCTIVGGCKEVFFFPAGPTILVCPSSGSGTFSGCSQEPPPPGTPLNQSLPPVSITATGVDPVYGTITTTLDPNRTSANATIVSNQANTTFPATVRISLFAQTTIATLSGTYDSRTQLVFVNKSVTSFRPFNNEKLLLESDVEFYNHADPLKKTVFVLKAGTSTVTLN